MYVVHTYVHVYVYVYVYMYICIYVYTCMNMNMTFFLTASAEAMDQPSFRSAPEGEQLDALHGRAAPDLSDGIVFEAKIVSGSREPLLRALGSKVQRLVVPITILTIGGFCFHRQHL